MTNNPIENNLIFTNSTDLNNVDNLDLDNNKLIKIGTTSGKDFWQKRPIKQQHDIIFLQFSKPTSGLAGFPFGEKIYHDQVENVVAKTLNDSERDIVLCLPEYVERVASSFVQGLFKEILDTLGYASTVRKLVVVSTSCRAIDSIYKNLY